ncbi:MAG: tRNA dihydrouridine(20/20a) synthase DusA [Paracoccaceae bacterium]
MARNSMKPTKRRLSVAPMMDWTDRHCRYFHRLLTRHARLYTEMVTSGAVLHGDRERLLAIDAAEHPVALQLGGADPGELAACVKIACDFGYDEVNLNIGCPSDRVRSGRFGAVLMKEPGLVADCAAAMPAATTGPEITVKCRIGVDDQEPREVLPDFLARVSAAGVRSFTIHARKAWLGGLSPKENRDVPPLDYGLVRRMKARFPQLEICINGGIGSLGEAEAHLAAGLDGVMIGRAAYHDPVRLLAAADARIFDDPAPPRDGRQAVRDFLPYIERELARGTPLNRMTRHILGVFTGRPGARRWRRVLSEGAHRDGAGTELVERALTALETVAA